MCKIKDGYNLELQTPETMKILNTTKNLVDKTENEENVPTLEVVEVYLFQYNIVDKQYRQKSELLYNFTPNKCYAYLLNIEPNNLMFLKTYNTEFDDNIVAFITTKNHHPTTTVHQREPAPPSPLLEIAHPTPLTRSPPLHSHPKGTYSFNRLRCSSLNRIRSSTELLVKNFFFQWSPLFSTCEPSNYNRPKKVYPIPIVLHPPPFPPPPQHSPPPGNTWTHLSVTNFLNPTSTLLSTSQVTTNNIH